MLSRRVGILVLLCETLVHVRVVQGVTVIFKAASYAWFPSVKGLLHCLITNSWNYLPQPLFIGSGPTQNDPHLLRRHLDILPTSMFSIAC